MPTENQSQSARVLSERKMEVKSKKKRKNQFNKKPLFC